MIAISIQKPDMGNIVAVRPNVPLVKGLAPVMDIVLAYSTSFPVLWSQRLLLMSYSWTRRLLLVPIRTRRPSRLPQSPHLRAGYRSHVLYAHICHNILLRRAACSIARSWFRVPTRQQDLFWHRTTHNHRRRRSQWLCSDQIHILSRMEGHQCSIY